MATINLNYPTILDLSKTFTTDGTPLQIVELLNQNNAILDDIPWREANGTDGDKISTRIGLPASTWRKLNGGVLPTKGNTAVVTEGMASLTQLGLADEKVIQLSTDIARARLNESAAHLEAMGQDFVQNMFYGDTNLTPERFLGLAPRYSDIGAGSPQNSENIIDALGTGTDNVSIWLVGWGEQGLVGIYPKGTKAGLTHQDMGVELTAAPDGTGMLRMYRDWFEWDCGISLRDWRNAVRIANIDASDLTKNAATGADLIDLMSQAVTLLHSRASVTPVFYVNRTIESFLTRQVNNKSNVWMSQGEYLGRKDVLMYGGIPVRRVDRLISTEARIV